MTTNTRPLELPTLVWDPVHHKVELQTRHITSEATYIGRRDPTYGPTVVRREARGERALLSIVAEEVDWGRIGSEPTQTARAILYDAAKTAGNPKPQAQLLADNYARRFVHKFLATAPIDTWAIRAIDVMTWLNHQLITNKPR